MKIKKIGDVSVVMSNPDGKMQYFAWPSIAKLQNGKIAVTASGYRYNHVCPFGKGVISYSDDEGETFTLPAPVFDTPLDDRDTGILAFGKSNVMVTSFNNVVRFQRSANENREENYKAVIDKYLDTITPEEESKYIGSYFRISNDCGTTFGKIHKSPVSSEHGPCVLHDGTVLWVGKVFSPDDVFTEEIVIQAHKINLDGSTELVGRIPSVEIDGEDLNLCEPCALELTSGKIICHIRAQKFKDGILKYFTTYQSESEDGGKTWTKPHMILDTLGGAPAHLILHSSGVIVSTYGHREKPYGIKAMFSKDGGETWDVGYDIYDGVDCDLGYPCSVELKDGSILTVFYDHRKAGDPVAVIKSQKWRLEDEI